MNSAGGSRDRRRKRQVPPNDRPYFPEDDIYRPQPSATSHSAGYFVVLPEVQNVGDDAPINHRAVFVDATGTTLHTANDNQSIVVNTRKQSTGLVFDIVTEYECLPLPPGYYQTSTFDGYFHDIPKAVGRKRASKSYISSRKSLNRESMHHEPKDSKSTDNGPTSNERTQKEPKENRSHIGPSPPDQWDDEKSRLMPVSVREALVKSIQGEHRLDLHSPCLIHAIRRTVQYWPEASLAGTPLQLREPYRLLVHHENELEAYAQRCAIPKTSENCELEKDVAEHLDLVNRYLETRIGASIRAERARHIRGYASFEHLWMLFKPGADVVVTIDDSFSRNVAAYRRGYVVESVRMGMGTDRHEARKAWTICLWGLAYDGSSIGRVSREVSVEEFKGEIEVATMAIVPANWPGHNVGEKTWAEVLKTNGELAYSLLWPQCLHHTGKAKEFPYRDVDGLVEVDMKTFYADNPDERPEFKPESTKATVVTGCYCAVCQKAQEEDNGTAQSRRKPFEGYNEIATDGGTLTEHQSFLFPSRVFAFCFRTRVWELVDVEDLGPARFESNILDTLVMKPGRIKLLKALSRNYMRFRDDKSERRREFWSADFIEGKGKSQIILLHGRPGVGKTYTAECIAEYTRRPLLSLTCADIGTYPEDVEDNLAYHFNVARDWGAFVLIDEADIYMERRSSNDLARNSLVASFLRALESYAGMLFLTTNRVGAFDDAFVSRMHVKLYYPPFTDEDRQRIWTTFINKLSAERRNDIRVTLNAKEYIKGKEMGSLDLNGREIRNAFQTAVALAEYEGKLDEEKKVMVEDHHIEQVAEMSRDFKNYLDELHRGDEEKRASRAYERHDK